MDPGFVGRVKKDRITSALLERDSVVIPIELSETHVNTSFNLSLNSRPPEKRFCELCRVEQPYRSKHCEICQGCVARFDHHCWLIGSCIGELNLRLYWAMLVIQSIVYLWMIFIVDLSVDFRAYLRQLIFPKTKPSNPTGHRAR